MPVAQSKTKEYIDFTSDLCTTIDEWSTWVIKFVQSPELCMYHQWQEPTRITLPKSNLDIDPINTSKASLLHLCSYQLSSQYTGRTSQHTGRTWRVVVYYILGKQSKPPSQMSVWFDVPAWCGACNDWRTILGWEQQNWSRCVTLVCQVCLSWLSSCLFFQNPTVRMCHYIYSAQP